MRGYVAVCLVSGLVALMSSRGAMAEVAVSGVRVVTSAEPTWLENHAAEELASYLGQMSGKKPAVLQAAALPEGDGALAVVMDSSRDTPLSRQINSLRPMGVPPELETPDSLAVQSLEQGNRPILLLEGNGPGVLYAVYDYLEDDLGCGFFPDGDYVPLRRTVPVEGLSRAEKPRFAERYSSLGGHWVPRKYHAQFWDLEQWKRELNWMAKRKLNLTGLYMGQIGDTVGDALSREVFADLGYPLPPPREEAEYTGWFSTGRTWPYEYLRDLRRELLEYGRQRGIRFLYYYHYGTLPKDVQTTYPDQFRYADIGNYAVTQFDPDEPMLRTFMAAYLKKTVSIFGTDHLYMCTPYSEAQPGASPSEVARVKATAGKRFLDLMLAFDPEGVWINDTWAFGEAPTPDFAGYNIRDYLATFPDDKLYIYDTSVDLQRKPFYKRYDYFFGKKWACGILQSMSGDDQFHGDLAYAMKVIQDCASDPRAANATGLFTIPELIHANILYWHLVHRLAWEPTQYRDQYDYIGDFVRHRYSSASYRNMYRAWSEVARAVYSGACKDEEFYGSDAGLPTYCPNYPFYKIAYWGFGCQNSVPVLEGRDKYIAVFMRHLPDMIPRLSFALDRALRQAEAERDNPLYENDLIDIFKSYCHQLYNYHMIRAYLAFKKADKSEFERHAAKCNEIMQAIAAVISNRPDYSLAQDIEDVMRVPGTNRFTPEMMLHASRAADYATNDTYEQVAGYYSWNMSAYFDVCRKKMAESKNTVTAEEMWPIFDGNAKNWDHADLSIYEKMRYPGKPLEAVRDCYSRLKDYGTIDTSLDPLGEPGG